MSKKSLPNKTFKAQMVQYLIDTYFDGDSAQLATQSGYTHHQIQSWINGVRAPREATLRWLLSSTIAPEFKVVCEFQRVKLSAKGEISSELNRVLGGHGGSNGVYAFYDSMCNLFYLGKASTSLKDEMYQQLRNDLGISFHKAVASAPKERWQVTNYVSAYEIPHVDHLDYPKHVEALFLRLAKPTGNKVIGRLPAAKPPKE